MASRYETRRSSGLELGPVWHACLVVAEELIGVESECNDKLEVSI